MAKDTTPPAEPEKETETPETGKTRERLAFSKDKKLAFLLLNVIGILESAKVVAVLTEEQKAAVVKAKTAATETMPDDPIAAVDKRVTAIQKELQAAQKELSDPAKMTAAIAKVKELALELDRQDKRKKQIQDLISDI